MMTTATDQRSLYDDWQLRRQRLLADRDGIEQYRRMQLRLLDYLLERYHDAPEAQQAARFPMPGDVRFNQRAIVVHHHLWPAETSRTKTIFDVNRRVSLIVSRMQTEVSAAQDTDSMGDLEDAMLGPIPARRSLGGCEALDAPTFETTFWLNVRDALRSLWWQARCVLRRGRPQRFSTKRFRRLFQRFSDPSYRDAWLLERLCHYDHPNLRHYAIQAWADRVRAGSSDDITNYLSWVISALGPFTERELDRIRVMLADENAAARSAAIDSMGKFGTLDDVALLCDLLALPHQANEDLQERDALATAAQQIAGRHRASL